MQVPWRVGLETLITLALCSGHQEVGFQVRLLRFMLMTDRDLAVLKRSTEQHQLSR